MGALDPVYWLPRNTTWGEMPTDASDLFIPIFLTIPALVFRVLWESFVGVPIGWSLGYGTGGLCSQVFTHLRGGFAANSRSKRVLECFWRLSFYSASLAYGAWVLGNSSWLWDVRECWIGYPQHRVEGPVWWYYMLEMTFYYSLLAASAFDVRRSDFWELIIHHVVTILLLSVSFSINFVRVGTLVLLSHDAADVLLEAGKLARYERNMAMCTNVLFVLFLLTWIVTRLGYFPFVLMRSAVLEAASLIQPDYEILSLTQLPFAPRLTILMLCALLVLHVFWTYIISKVVYATVTQGEAKDVRSDSEESDEEEAEEDEERRKVLSKKRPLKQD